MSKVYFISLSLRTNRQAAIALLQERKLISDWFYNLPYSFFVRSDYTANDISQALIERFGKERHFVVASDGDRQGVLPVKHWERMRKNG